MMMIMMVLINILAAHAMIMAPAEVRWSHTRVMKAAPSTLSRYWFPPSPSLPMHREPTASEPAGTRSSKLARSNASSASAAPRRAAPSRAPQAKKQAVEGRHAGLTAQIMIRGGVTADSSPTSLKTQFMIQGGVSGGLAADKRRRL